jgi:hypothetical protein
LFRIPEVEKPLQGMRLIRDDQDDIRTLGTMFYGEERLCETLELPWRDNYRGISCIPEGAYECRIGHSPFRGYPVYWLQDVPGRSDVQIHIGNFPKDIRGCILVGTERGTDMVVHSKIAFNKFMERMGGKDFTLEITKGGVSV